MPYLPMPVETMSEALEAERIIMEGMSQEERYDGLARSSRINELNSLVENGVASPEQRDELVHRISTNPQMLRMIELGRAEIRAFLDADAAEAPFIKDNIPAPLIELVLEGDVATLARFQVEKAYLAGAVENNMATDAEIALHENVNQSGPMAFLKNPQAELIEWLENPDTAKIEPSEMMANFEGLAPTLNAIMAQQFPELEAMLERDGTSREQMIADLRSEMNQQFGGAAEGASVPAIDPEAQQPQADQNPALKAGL